MASLARLLLLNKWTLRSKQHRQMSWLTQVWYRYIWIQVYIKYRHQVERTEKIILFATIILLSHQYLPFVPVTPVSKTARWGGNFCFSTLFCSEVMLIIKHYLSDFLKIGLGITHSRENLKIKTCLFCSTLEATLCVTVQHFAANG